LLKTNSKFPLLSLAATCIAVVFLMLFSKRFADKSLNVLELASIAVMVETHSRNQDYQSPYVGADKKYRAFVVY